MGKGLTYNSSRMRLASPRFARNHVDMFTIEHDFDATVVTLVDEGNGTAPLMEDVSVQAFEDCVVIEQYDARTDKVSRVTFSLPQLRELAMALDLPEGSYSLSGKGNID